MKTLVLCGGAGTRLRPVLNGTPKPLAVVEGKPMLEWILISLRARGLSDVTLCTGYKSEAQQCFALEPVCADARTFLFPLEPLVVYLFNPFPEDVLRQVVQNLKLSLEQYPRPAYLIYHNAVLPFVIDDTGMFRKIAQAEHYSIYVSPT